jgi:hypothetical protein
MATARAELATRLKSSERSVSFGQSLAGLARGTARACCCYLGTIPMDTRAR